VAGSEGSGSETSGSEGSGSEVAAGRIDTDQVAALAGLTGATSIVWGLPGYGSSDDPDGWDRRLMVWNGGVVDTVGPLFGDGAWVGDGFIYTSDFATNKHIVYDLAGDEVCVVGLEPGEEVHHATSRADGTVVLGIDIPANPDADEGDGRVQSAADALDCETGERRPIAPFLLPAGEVESYYVTRVGDQVFRQLIDAEGNTAELLNEAGLDLVVGEDWAGHVAFDAGALIVAYSDQAPSFSPHVSPYLKVRSAITGELLWSLELPELIAGLHFIDDRLIVGQGTDDGGWVPTDSVAVFDAVSGEPLGQVAVPYGLAYIG
jgi:hypothetical protein